MREKGKHYVKDFDISTHAQQNTELQSDMMIHCSILGILMNVKGVTSFWMCSHAMITQDGFGSVAVMVVRFELHTHTHRKRDLSLQQNQQTIHPSIPRASKERGL